MARKKKPELIPSVGYLRKSTVDEKTKTGRTKRQSEKSISQQKKEATALADGNYQIVDWYQDENTPGWKRGTKRPGFQAIMDRAREQGDFQAIICDNLDRFSRAEFDDVQEDARALKKAGVRWIVTAAQGTFDLGRGNDIGEILKFAVAVWSAHEYSRQLSRRVSIARRNRAVEGKRTGGPVPYGLVSDGDGGLNHGDKQELKHLRWIFDQFTNKAKSLNWIAADLNRREVASPRGGLWRPATVKTILKQRCYCGDFEYNKKPEGQFFHIDGKGEVVPAKDCEGHKVFIVKDVYTPVIARALWNRTQKRLIQVGGSRCGRKAMYPLSGVLVCGHCGSGLTGCQPNGKTVYRCPGMKECGPEFCAAPYQVREDVILPFLMRMLGEEIKDLEKMLSTPPDDVRSPWKGQTDRCKKNEQERDQLLKQIKQATKNVMFCDDARTRRDMDAELSEMRNRLDTLEATLNNSEPKVRGYTRPELEALTRWWAEFEANSVSVPIDGEVPDVAATFYVDPFAEDERRCYLIDGQVANAKLKELGTKVELWWETKQGKERPRHTLVRGRFRMGQKRGDVPVTSFGNSGSPQ